MSECLPHMRTSLSFFAHILDEELTYKEDKADHQRAEERTPKATDGESNPKLIPDPARKGKQSRINDQDAKPQSQDDEWTTQNYQDGTHNRIDDAKDQCQPDETQPVLG